MPPPFSPARSFASTGGETGRQCVEGHRTGQALSPTAADRPCYLFVTGRLAEFALRRMLDELAPKAGFQAEVAVLPISVAALMTPRWVARHLDVSEGVEKVILPGNCRGDLSPIVERPKGCRLKSAQKTCAICLGTSASPHWRAGWLWRLRHRDHCRDQPCTLGSSVKS